MDRDRLERLLGQPPLRRLLDRLRRRIESGGDPAAPLQLPDVSEEERRAVGTLLGRPAGRGSSLRVLPSELEEVLRRCGAAADLRTALEALRGPLRDRRREREEARAAWEKVFAGAEAEAQILGLAGWLQELGRGGVLKRLAGTPDHGSELLGQALQVLRRLPARGISLSRLAAETLGDAHALDPGRPAATLVCRAIAERFRLSGDEGPEGVRDLWAAAGILVGGAVTSTVLVLNLPARPENPCGRMLAGMAGEPVWLTLRQMLRHPLSFDLRERPVFICENPAVVAEAAEELGAASPTLVCTSGQRNSAVTTLLRQLAGSGARLRYHGDFDWKGIVIANGIIGGFGALPWRYVAADYRRAAPASSLPLASQPVEALWDPDLAPAMKEAALAVHEEQVLADLLEDLRACKHGETISPLTPPDGCC